MLRLIAVFSFLSCTLSQSPGDGDALCIEPFIDGQQNPFFSNRPVYPANVGVLMDSRDYANLLQQGAQQGNMPVWQQVDNDNNNSDTVFTSVSCSILAEHKFSCTSVYSTCHCKVGKCSSSFPISVDSTRPCTV